MRDAAGERQKEHIGLSITSGSGGERGDLDDAVNAL